MRLLLPRLGAKVVFCGPAPLLPDTAAEIGPGVEIDRDFDSVLDRSQVVMMLRIQAERLAGMRLDLDEYKTRYQLTAGATGCACAEGADAASGADHSRAGT